MAHITEPRIGETTTTAGAGPWTTTAALISHFRFSTKCAIGDTFWGDIEGVGTDGLPNGEVVEGLCTYSAANQITLTTPYRGSSGDSTPVTFTAGTTQYIRLIADARQIAKLELLSGTNTGDQTSVSGNAGTATTLANGRTLAITGDLAWTSPSFNGSANVTAAGTLAAVNASPGTYTNATVVVNAKGLATTVTSGAAPGTVTATAGALTANAVVLGAGTTDTKVSTGITTDGVGAVTLTPAANTSAITIASHTHTTSNPAINVAQTWNAAGVTFSASTLNVTNTASAAGSLLQDWQIATTSVANVRKDGLISSTKNGTHAIGIQVSGFNFVGIGRNSTVGGLNVYDGTSGTPSETNPAACFVGNTLRMQSTSLVTWTTSNVTQNPDTGLGRNGAGIAEVNSGTSGTFRDLKLRNLLVQSGVVTLGIFTVATLPTGTRASTAYVTDANTTFALGLGLTVVGGGANEVTVFYNNSNWLIG